MVEAAALILLLPFVEVCTKHGLDADLFSVARTETDAHNPGKEIKQPRSLESRTQRVLTISRPCPLEQLRPRRRLRRGPWSRARPM